MTSEQLTVQKLEKANLFGSLYSIDFYRPTSSNHIASRETAAEIYEKKLSDAWEKSQAAHARNVPALEINKRIREYVKGVMKIVGIPEGWTDYEFKTSRSKNRTPVNKTAGFMADLVRFAPVSDDFADAERFYKQATNNLATYRAETNRMKREAEQKSAAEAQARKSSFELAEIVLRRKMSRDSDWDSVLNHLLDTNKYLRLAYAMEQTRGDWSEGFYRVESAHGAFVVETDLDREIDEDIAACLDSEETDGRIFRDTKWSYGALYALVTDEQLMADFELARTHVDRDRWGY